MCEKSNAFGTDRNGKQHDCGNPDPDKGCGCSYCFSCNACEECLNEDK